MKSSPRICVRLGVDRMDRLQKLCKETDQDVSRAVRQALDTLLANASASAPGEASHRRLSPPEQVFGLVPRYLGWVRGDLREELKRLFRELLAANFAAKKLYPRTAGVAEGYEGLLQLCKFFGLD